MSDKILLLLFLFIGCLGAIKFSERFSQRNKIKPVHYFGIATVRPPMPPSRWMYNK